MKNLYSSDKRLLSEKLSSIGKHTRHSRWRLFSILVLGVFLSGCSGLLGEKVTPMAPITIESTFEQHEIITGLAKHQTVLTGFLLDGDLAELIVVNIDKNDNRHLRIYAFRDGVWVLRLDTALRPEVLFVDVANIGGQDRLITYEQGCLNWFDPESSTEHTLVKIPSMIPPLNGNIPHVDITRDVNGDTRDDLVVPDSDGFWVFIQTTDGTFADSVKLGPSTEVDRIYETDEYRHMPWNQSRIHETDYNRDGHNDLVFWNADHFEIHHQDEGGLFSPVATTFSTDVVFDSDELASLAAPYGVRRRQRDHQPTGDITGRVLHAIKDMNGDGVTDLGVFSLEGGSLWHMHSTYEVYFGTPAPDGNTTFALDVNTALHSDGIPFGIEQHDFNRDGQVDMMFTTIKPRIFKVISMLIGGVLTGSVPLDVAFHHMEGSTYADNPNTTCKIKSYPSDETGGRTVFSSMLIGDVNGDERADLLVQQGPKQLRVYSGAPGPKLFKRKPQKVAVATPFDERNIWLVDLNKDNKQDIFIYHPSTIEPHRVTLLIAQ